MILIFLDDVLRTPKNAPLYEGIALYRLFKDSEKVVIACKDESEADRWCKQNNVIHVDDFVDYSRIPTALEDHDYRLVDHCRSRGGLQLVVTGSPELAAKLLERGVHTLLFLHPSYTRHEFRPDSRQGIKSWADIQSEIEKQIEMLASDGRA